MFSVKNMTIFALAAVATVAPAAADSRMRRPRGERDDAPRTRDDRRGRGERPEDEPRFRDGMYGDVAGAYGDVAGEYGDVAGAYGDASEDVCDFSILDAVLATPDLSTLGVAIEAAGLAEGVSDPSLQVTVLAPTNSAFAELDEDVLASLLEQPEALSAILNLHVIAGVAFSTDLTDGMVATTLAGPVLTIGVSEEGVTFTTEAGTVGRVVTPDIPVCSSVVHIIDTVLL